MITKYFLAIGIGVLMNMNIIKSEEAFNVIGIATRTTTQAELQGANLIGSLWQKLFAEQILDKIPHRIDADIIALYTDFASDKNGEYTVVIGARVSSLDQIPDGMHGCHIPAQKTAVFVTECGPFAQVVIDTWKTIWTLEDQGKLKHSYQTDYEVYDARALDPQNAQVEIHVGVAD